MRQSLSALIFWGELRTESFLYGTRLRYRAKDWIEFENEFVPAGKSLHSWYSKTIYQRHREAPQLPYLRVGQTHYLQAHMQSHPANSIYFKVSFYDRFEKLISAEVIRSTQESFTPPEGMYSYQIELLNAGCRSFTFHAFEIVEADLFESHDLSTLCSVLVGDEEDTSKAVNIIFVEPNLYRRDTLDLKPLAHIPNVRLITSRGYLSHGFSTKEFEEIIKDFQIEAQAKGQEINLIGYGPIGNLAVLHYVNQHVAIHGFVTDDLHVDALYQEQLSVYQTSGGFFEPSTIDKLLQSDQVQIYWTQNDQYTQKNLVQILMDKSQRLENLSAYLEDESR